MNKQKFQAKAKKHNFPLRVEKEWNGYGYVVIGRHISDADYATIAAEVDAEQAEEAQKLRKLLTPAKVAEAIYSINKEAKRQRDLQYQTAGRIAWRAGGGEDYYDDDNEDQYLYQDDYSYQLNGLKHRILQAAKREKARLYTLKDEALRKLIEELALTPAGYHEFKDTCRLMYEYVGFSFHIEGNINGLVNLGKIEGWIDASRKRSMPPRKAEKLLQYYLNTIKEKKNE